MAQPTVSAGLVSGLIHYAGRRGADMPSLIAAAGLTTADLDDADALLPFIRYADAIRVAARMLADPAIALHYGEAVGMAELSVVGLIMEASATMGAAFGQLQRYGRLVVEVDDAGGGQRFQLTREGDRLYLVDHRRDPNAFPELTEGAFARLTCGPRRFLTRQHVLGAEVTHPAPQYHGEYERVLGCPVRFDAPRNALELPLDIAGWPISPSPRYVFGALIGHAEELLTGQAVASSVRNRLEALLLPLLHHGDIDSTDMAAQLGFSRPTLFRRLRAEGTSYAAVVADLRRRLAIQYLRGRRVSVNETAYLVGFSEAAAFSRAFKRWTGQSPGALRDR